MQNSAKQEYPSSVVLYDTQPQNHRGHLITSPSM